MGSARLKLGAAALVLVAAIGAAAWLFLSNTGEHGTWERITVHGKALEGSLEGDSADRTVFVYLPASYRTQPERRYPVVYNLHGFTATAKGWTRTLKWPGALDRVFGSGAAREMIVVSPDAMTLQGGSFYSSSVVTGDWERFIAEDLVAYIDGHYRTLADRGSRGLTGHSMGGYGAVRIGIRRSDVFSAVYALNACCLVPRTADWTGVRESEAILTLDQAAKAEFETRAAVANAAAWSPNPANPPLFSDKPTLNGQPRPEIMAKWAANAPLAMLDQYLPNLKRLNAIGIDLARGDIDVNGSTSLHKALDARGVAHVFETYEGDHNNRMPERYETKVLPFFSARLAFEPAVARHSSH